MTDDREVFKVRRAAGKAKTHEKRLESATYTAAEVRVLTETASKVAYELGRKDAYDREHMVGVLEAEWLKHAEDKTVDSPRGHCERLVDALIAARHIGKGDPTT